MLTPRNPAGICRCSSAPAPNRAPIPGARWMVARSARTPLPADQSRGASLGPCLHACLATRSPKERAIHRVPAATLLFSQLRSRGNGLARMSRVHVARKGLPGRDVMVKVIALDIHDH